MNPELRADLVMTVFLQRMDGSTNDMVERELGAILGDAVMAARHIRSYRVCAAPAEPLNVTPELYDQMLTSARGGIVGDPYTAGKELVDLRLEVARLRRAVDGLRGAAPEPVFCNFHRCEPIPTMNEDGKIIENWDVLSRSQRPRLEGTTCSPSSP